MRWGILGTARINRRVIPAMRLAKRSELIAVASRDRARAEWYAREWSIPRAIAGYQTLLDDSSIDAVYIPLPNTGHVEWTLAAIAAGKHVLCEKPIALDPHDVDRIAAAAAAANVVVEEGFSRKFPEAPDGFLEALLHSGPRVPAQGVSQGGVRQPDSFRREDLDNAIGVEEDAVSRMEHRRVGFL